MLDAEFLRGGGRTWGVAPLCAMLVLAGCSARNGHAEQQAATVVVATASRGSQPLTLTGLGHVEGLYTASARAQTSGIIQSVSFHEGQNVDRGQPLARIDPRPLQATLAQDEATLARDRAAVANARDMLSRNAPLVGQGLASAQQVATYRAQLSQAMATVAGDRAAMDRDRLTLGYTVIRAPIAGVAGIRQIDPGNLVGPNDPTGLVTIAQIQPIAVVFALPQADIERLRGAMAAAGRQGVAVDALAQDGGQVLDHGRLLVMNNQVDSGSGTVALKAVFPNANRQLWPGEMVMARIAIGQDANAVTVPSASVQANASGNFVWIVGPKGTAVMRPVLLGARLGGRVIVAHGLSGGERVVTDGQFGLSQGAPVRIAAAAPPTPLKSDNPDRLGIQP